MNTQEQELFNEMAITDLLKKANRAYRLGEPIMPDSEYDKLLETLPEEHILRKTVEPEKLTGDLYNHPIEMLSTQKAKTDDQVAKWINKVQNWCITLGIDPTSIDIRVTAKLDGMAAKFYEDGTLVTRGDGQKGNIVTSAFRKGVIDIHDEFGLGELVINKKYFDENLADSFAHPRNVVVGIVMSDEVNDISQKALDDNAVHFANYNHIFSITTNILEFKQNYRTIEKTVSDNTIYPIDGVVIEVVNGYLKKAMGSTNHHNNWQIALKPKDEEAITKVKYINWQTGRTGKVTPVMNVEATELDGSVVRRVTAHNAKTVEQNGIGVGSKISIIRSGGVIPKLEKVLETGEVGVPHFCSSCGSVLNWTKTDTDLICNNTLCSAQHETRIRHFFHTIGNVDGFGPSTISKLVTVTYCNTIPDIYMLSIEDFESIGFGLKTSINLHNELIRSTNTPLEDWRFLAAFGVRNLGKGNAKKLLKHYPITDIFVLDKHDISAIEGFGDISSDNIVHDLDLIREDFELIFDSFNLIYTDDTPDFIPDSAISGMNIVFTGKMDTNRDSMKGLAESKGAIAQNGVNSKTDYLVIGANVGQSKLDKAEKFGTKVIKEHEFYDLINK